MSCLCLGAQPDDLVLGPVTSGKRGSVNRVAPERLVSVALPAYKSCIHICMSSMQAFSTFSMAAAAAAGWPSSRGISVTHVTCFNSSRKRSRLPNYWLSHACVRAQRNTRRLGRVLQVAKLEEAA